MSEEEGQKPIPLDYKGKEDNQKQVESSLVNLTGWFLLLVPFWGVAVAWFLVVVVEARQINFLGGILGAIIVAPVVIFLMILGIRYFNQ